MTTTDDDRRPADRPTPRPPTTDDDRPPSPRTDRRPTRRRPPSDDDDDDRRHDPGPAVLPRPGGTPGRADPFLVSVQREIPSTPRIALATLRELVDGPSPPTRR
jgi:hypothetical protein